ncbi:hypothetical protein HPULCUR_009537 [Helicostylum pulchrum]|uniref:Uncharacterized protein n=1 Tax=Helicostylum pulchrum TaxID=562976 RepID=A0ABP9YAS8_9FUNG
MRSQILIALRNYLTANNASLMLSGTEKGIQRDLGNSLQLFGFHKSWGTAGLISTCIRNTKNNNIILVAAVINISSFATDDSIPMEYNAVYSDEDNENFGSE